MIGLLLPDHNLWVAQNYQCSQKTTKKNYIAQMLSTGGTC